MSRVELGKVYGTCLVRSKTTGPSKKTAYWNCRCTVCGGLSVRTTNVVKTNPKSCSNCVYKMRVYPKITLPCNSCGVNVVTDSNRTKAYCSKLCRVAAAKGREKDSRSSSVEGTLKSILHGIKSRAAKKQLAVDLDIEFLLWLYEQQNGKCSRTGRTLLASSGACKVLSVSDTVSVDRVDSTKGYTKDNVELVTYSYNTAKNTMTTEEFITMCKQVLALAESDSLGKEGTRQS